METVLLGNSKAFWAATLPNSSRHSSTCFPRRFSCLAFGNGCYDPSPASSNSLFINRRSGRKAVIVEARKRGDNSSKNADNHRFSPKPDEATGPYPEAILLKEKKVQEDGKLQPEFADSNEEELFEYLNLELESDMDVETRRHYEVVYLIHENHKDKVNDVNEKIQDFLREKKGKVWRFSDWGMRRLAYKIQKAKNAHYILMNFEIEAKWINEFKTMLDKDERVIRHLVIKRDKAITEDCPPPPEFHTLRADMVDDDDDDVIEVDDFDDEEDGEWDDGDDELEGGEEEDAVQDTEPVKAKSKQLA